VYFVSTLEQETTLCLLLFHVSRLYLTRSIITSSRTSSSSIL